jgi:methyl-accepting chemotaxis protein
MGYPDTDEEFYAMISNKLEEIYSLRDLESNMVPMETRRELYYQIYRLMGDYVESKNRSQEIEDNFKRFGENLDLLRSSLYNIGESIKEIHESERIALMNAQLAAAGMSRAVNKMNKLKQEVSETTRGLLRKIDARNTILDLTKGMTSQKKD